jgi:hypothetical protein
LDRRGMGRIKEMKNWQKKEFGQEIISLLKSLK